LKESEVIGNNKRTLTWLIIIFCSTVLSGSINSANPECSVHGFVFAATSLGVEIRVIPPTTDCQFA
jgi:hypothetical protein